MKGQIQKSLRHEDCGGNQGAQDGNGDEPQPPVQALGKMSSSKQHDESKPRDECHNSHPGDQQEYFRPHSSSTPPPMSVAVKAATMMYHFPGR